MKRLFCVLVLCFAVAPSSVFALELPRSLSRGNEGADVLALQQELAALGFFTATPNGYFGPATEQAVKAFQKVQGIEQVGNVGPQTRAAFARPALLALAPKGATTEGTTTPVAAVPTAPDPFAPGDGTIRSELDSIWRIMKFSSKIDSLDGANLINVRIQGASGLTDSDIPDTITVSGDQTLDSLTVSDWIDVRDAKLMVPFSANPSSSCTPGELTIDSDATSGQRLFLCESADTWVLQGDGNTGGAGDSQTIDVFSLSGDTLSLSIENDGEATKTVDFSSFATNAELLAFAGSSNIATLGTVTTGVWQGTAIADGYLTKTGDWTGTLDGYEAADLLDNTDAQTLSLTSNTLSISGGNSVDLSGYLDAVSYTAGAGITLSGTQFSLGFSDSAGLRGVLSDETGTGAAVFATSPAFTTGATINGYRVGTIEGVTETNTMLTQVAQTTVTGTAVIDFTNVGLRDYTSAPMVMVTPVFDATGVDQLSCTPHTVTTTGMVIDCAYATGSGLSSVISLDIVPRTVTYMLVGIAP